MKADKEKIMLSIMAFMLGLALFAPDEMEIPLPHGERIGYKLLTNNLPTPVALEIYNSTGRLRISAHPSITISSYPSEFESPHTSASIIAESSHLQFIAEFPDEFGITKHFETEIRYNPFGKER